MPKEKEHLSKGSRLVFEPKKQVCQAGIVLFRGFLIEGELRHNENGEIHLLLRFQEKVYVVLFRMEEMSGKTFWIQKEDERGGPLLNGIPVKPGSVRTGKATASDEG